jgi:acetate---CoA ligase (ADP-forming)
MTDTIPTHPLDCLFLPRSVAIVGAGPNDPSRMGTRTLFDLVEAGWKGRIYPVSSRHAELYGLATYRSLREVPAAPDVVLARTPSSGADALVDEAIAVGARFLIVLASGFAESGEPGEAAQRRLVERARQGGLRIVGPQSIGLVNGHAALPLSLSQIMERFRMESGPVALLTQSGAMAISLAVRGQKEFAIGYGCIATFGNAADLTPAEALGWLAGRPETTVIGMYLEGLRDAASFVEAVQACRARGKTVVVLRAGLSPRGAAAVASHTASMTGDADAFCALCEQLGVIRCDTADEFLGVLKTCQAGRVAEAPKVAFASISGGACALWADLCAKAGLDLPDLPPAERDAVQSRLPSFLHPANPMDLGPAVFNDESFEASLRALLASPAFSMLVVYMFTSSPSLMGGRQKIRLLEEIAAAGGKPVWVVWEAATDEEWTALQASTRLRAFRDLGQAARVLRLVAAGAEPLGYRPDEAPRERPPGPPLSERQAKQMLREAGLPVPAGESFASCGAAAAFARTIGARVVLKIDSPDILHKTEAGGVVFAAADDADLEEIAERMVTRARNHCPGARIHGVLVEEQITDGVVELFVTVRRDPALGLVTVIGRGGEQIELERDYVVRVGRLDPDHVRTALARLRCAPLLSGYRSRPAAELGKLAQTVVELQSVLLRQDWSEVEINPLLAGKHQAWVLDALVRG